MKAAGQFCRIKKNVMMKQFLLALLSTSIATGAFSNPKTLNETALKELEYQLDDVMEIMDTSFLKEQLRKVESDYSKTPNALNKLRLGIVYHEVGLNLSFFSSDGYKGFPKKSFDVLSELLESGSVTAEMIPFILSYRASALSLVSAETRKLKPLHQAFDLFEEAVEQYAHVSYLPEFLRGSVAENLPNLFFLKRRHAMRDFESIIQKQESSPAYANNKIMSFTYWAWANQHQKPKHRKLALSYLNKAIALDPDYIGGRQRAEDLKAKLN